VCLPDYGIQVIAIGVMIVTGVPPVNRIVVANEQLLTARMPVCLVPVRPLRWIPAHVSIVSGLKLGIQEHSRLMDVIVFRRKMPIRIFAVAR